ncbi:unnamed protein product, partial [Staurois parvus]
MARSVQDGWMDGERDQTGRVSNSGVSIVAGRRAVRSLAEVGQTSQESEQEMVSGGQDQARSATSQSADTQEP